MDELTRRNAIKLAAAGVVAASGPAAYARRAAIGGRPTDITHLRDDGFNPPKRFEPDAAGWVPDGRCVAYREDGSLLLDMVYDRGVPHGPYREYWSTGRLATEGQYVSGVQEGEWRFYDRGPGEPPDVVQFVAGRQVVDWDEFFGRPRSQK